MAEAHRHIRLTWAATGESVVANMLEDEAPQMCQWIWSRLPFEQQAVHGKYSQSELVVPLDNPQPAPRENLTQMPLPGELLYFYESSITFAGRVEEVGQIRLVYGRGVLFRDPEGVPAYGVLFARIPGDWLRDWRDFANACRRLQDSGSQVLRLEASS